MTLLYDNARLFDRLAITLKFLVVRWQDGIGTQWYGRLNVIRKRKEDVASLYSVVSVVPFTVLLQLRWLQIGQRILWLLAETNLCKISMFYILLHAYVADRRGDIFINTVCLVGNRWEHDDVKRYITWFKPHWPFQGGTPFKNCFMFLWVFWVCFFQCTFILFLCLGLCVFYGWLSA